MSNVIFNDRQVNKICSEIIKTAEWNDEGSFEMEDIEIYVGAGVRVFATIDGHSETQYDRVSSWYSEQQDTKNVELNNVRIFVCDDNDEDVQSHNLYSYYEYMSRMLSGATIEFEN